MKLYFLSNKSEFINISNNVKEVRPLVGATPAESC